MRSVGARGSEEGGGDVEQVAGSECAPKERMMTPAACFMAPL
jgi:hypothetical protein